MLTIMALWWVWLIALIVCGSATFWLFNYFVEKGGYLAGAHGKTFFAGFLTTIMAISTVVAIGLLYCATLTKLAIYTM